MPNSKILLRRRREKQNEMTATYNRHHAHAEAMELVEKQRLASHLNHLQRAFTSTTRSYDREIRVLSKEFDSKQKELMEDDLLRVRYNQMLPNEFRQQLISTAEKDFINRRRDSLPCQLAPFGSSVPRMGPWEANRMGRCFSPPLVPVSSRSTPKRRSRSALPAVNREGDGMTSETSGRKSRIDKKEVKGDHSEERRSRSVCFVRVPDILEEIPNLRNTISSASNPGRRTSMMVLGKMQLRRYQKEENNRTQRLALKDRRYHSLLDVLQAT